MKQSKNFIITLNNPKVDIHGFKEIVEKLGFTYGRMQLEKGENGTPHIQACFGGKQYRFTALKKHLPEAHIESARDAYKAWQYCGKEDTRVEGPIEFGIPPAQRNVKGNCAARNAMLIEKGAAAAVRDGDIPISQIAKLKHAIELYRSITSKPADIDQLDNYWLYGPPGTGKSRSARLRWPELYNKPLNKWWCEYEREGTILLDDFSKEHKVLAAHLKNWADHYSYVGETKGGGMTMRPQRFVVTSNYTPEEIFDDPVTCEAIRRRFKFEHFNEPLKFDKN